jgi:transposase
VLATDKVLPHRLRFEPPEFELPEPLPSDPDALRALLIAQRRAMAELQRTAHEHLASLYEQIALMRLRQFGPSSEAMPGQVRLFDEAEALAAQPCDDAAGDEGEAQDPTTAEARAPNKRARGKRAPLPSELARVDIVHEVPEAERTCPCGTPMVGIGEEIGEQLDIVPMRVQVLRHIRRRYGCPGSAHAPVTAPMPAQPLPKSNASPDLLAMLIAVKYVDGLPLARFEPVHGRSRVSVPRQTLARWIIRSAEQVLQPVFNLLRDTLLDHDLIHIDETAVQVLEEAGRAATCGSYMWVQTGGPPARPVILYDYDPSRSGEVPKRLLADWRGYLMTDGYRGYDAVVKAQKLTHLACMAHVRRGFVEATASLPKGKPGRAGEAIELIRKLYRVEREAMEAGIAGEPLAQTHARRLAARHERSKPLLEDLRIWLDTTRPKVTPSARLGQAIAYAHKYWARIERYTERGDLPIDNNRCEGAIRPFVVGRKAWMFSDTPAGANASAMIYSLVHTAKANALDPYAWMRLLMRKLPAARSVEDYEALLPWNLHPDRLSIPFRA